MNTDEQYVNDLVHMTYLADTLVRHSSIIQLYRFVGQRGSSLTCTQDDDGAVSPP